MSSLISKAQDPNFHIYLCFGQSNMEGQGNIEAQDQTVNSRFQIMESMDCSNLSRQYGKWYTAVPPLVRCYTKLGPADYFGRTMVANTPSNIKIGVVNVSIAGCDIALFGKTGYAGYDTYNVIPAKYNGSAYAWLLEVAKLAQKDGVIKGILMHQGETNTGQTTWPAKVKGVYDNLIADLGLTASQTPFLLGEMLYANQGGQCAAHNPVIATVPSVIPNSYVISASGLTGMDQYHFSSAGYRTLGERYAQKMLTLVSTTPTTPTGAGGTPVSTTFTGSPASCVITAPHANSYFQDGKAVTVNVYSLDIGGTTGNGTVTRVELFDGDTYLTESTAATNGTYTFNLNCLTVGTHILKARAVDNSGNVSASAGVLVNVGTAAVTSRGMSANKGKYLANIVAGSVPQNYMTYWNGVTAENNNKWGVIESTRDNFNWNAADISYNFAKNNNLMYRYHAIAWGSQFPNWAINSSNQLVLSPAEFQAEIEEYMAAVAQRYGNYIDQIDVLNEQLRTHAPATQAFKTGLGGGGTTGYDWIIWLFTKARQYFPNAKLVLNDYGLENDISAINEQLNVIKVLRDRNLIDGFGTQAHEFNINTLSASQMTNALNTMDNSGVPTYVTELDLSGTDAEQNTRYQTLFPVYWNHPSVGGISLWGYIEGTTWIANTGLVSSGNNNPTESPAMQWLKQYMSQQTNVGYPYATKEPTAPCNNCLTPAPTVTSTVNYAMGATASPLTATGTALLWYTAASGGTGSTTAPTPSTAAVGSTIYYVSQTLNGCEGSRASITVTVSLPPGSNLLNNGEFDLGTQSWDIQNNSGANGTMTVVTNANMSGTNALRVCATNAGTATWHVQVRQNAPFEAGKQYEVSFMAKADAARTMEVAIQMEGDPWTSYFGQTQNLTTVNQTFTYTFSPTVTDATAKLKFYLGNSTTCVTIDNVVFKEAAPCTPPTATITTTTPTTFCQGGSVVLSANTGTGLTYQWRNGTTNITSATGSSYTATTAGAYNVIVSNATNCSTTSTSTTVTVNPLPTATITASGATTFCQGGSVTLNANTGTGLTYQWKNGTTAVGAGSSSLAIYLSSGSYTVEVTNASNCMAVSTPVVVTVNTPPTATITTTTPTTFCQGGSVVLSANTGTGLTYQWRNGTTNIATATATTYTANASGDYNVVVTNASTCSATSTNTTVTVNPLPTATITTTTPTTFCQGGSVVLSANTGTGLTYQWRNGTTNIATATGSSYTANAAGSYNVIVTNASNCSATSTNTTVTVNALPTATVTAGSATTFCQGESVVLSANTGTGLTYQWRNGTTNIATATASTYTATTAGDYNVIVSSGNCSATSTNTTVTVNALPTATITTTTPTTFCQGGSVVLSANTGTGLTYQWRSGTTNIATATGATYTATTAGTYNVIVTNASNCSTTSTNTTVTVNALPTATVTTTTSTTFCQGGSVVLSANTGTGLTYQWRNGTSNIASATGSSYTATTAGSYNVVVSSGNCSATSTSTTVTVNALPTATITAGGATTFCQGGSVVLSANTGTSLTYQWRNGTSNIASATGATYTATTAGSYNVVVSSGNCSATSTNTTVTVNALPTATITAGGATTFCQGGSVVLSANTGTGLTYQWRNGTSNIASATGATYTANSSGNYNVIVSSGNCSATSTSTTVTVNAPISVSVTPNGIQTLIPSQPITLTATTSATGVTYTWYNGTSVVGSNSATLSVTTAGNYSVQITNGSCQATSNTVSVVNANAPLVSMISPTNNGTAVAPANILLEAQATDSDGSITKVEFYQNNVKVGEGTGTTSYQYTLTNVAQGAYTFYAVATDNSGLQTTSASVNFTVGVNQSPIVNTFTATYNQPTPGSSSTGSIDIAVNAQDPEGGALTVEIYDGTTLLTTLTNAPYTYTYNNPSVGTHDIVVKVKDSEGNTVTQTQSVTVIPASTPTRSANSLQVTYYPNPYREVITIEGEGSMDYIVQDMRGHEVERGTINSIGQVGANLPAAQYIVILQNQDKRSVIKIEKQ
ncbi:MAG: endo-1,4-beta-xylanase [Cytophagaceae bacterium]